MARRFQLKRFRVSADELQRIIIMSKYVSRQVTHEIRNSLGYGAT
jgi:hypothetical protein